jgi:hypothetical protein
MCGWAVGGPAASHPLAIGFQPNSRQESEPTIELQKSGIEPSTGSRTRPSACQGEERAKMGSRPSFGRRPASLIKGAQDTLPCPPGVRRISRRPAAARRIPAAASSLLPACPFTSLGC